MKMKMIKTLNIPARALRQKKKDKTKQKTVMVNKIQTLIYYDVSILEKKKKKKKTFQNIHTLYEFTKCWL